MSETAEQADYLARGGKYSAPDNASARYRGELMRLMASFVDSQLAAAAGFADCINTAPGLDQRLAAARITAGKLEHARGVLAIMASFGADPTRYVSRHPWAARLARDADIGTTRRPGDMRLNVFHYPFTGWIDAVVMNTAMGRASIVQIDELTAVSYQPLGEAFVAILEGERRHADLGARGLAQIVAEPAARPEAQASVDYWYPRIAASFGEVHSKRFEQLSRLGLRHQPNDILLARWQTDIAEILTELGLEVPVNESD